MSYNFEFVGGHNNSFIIVTNSDVVYEIKFKPSDYLLEIENLKIDFVFEFVIEVLFKPENIALTLDKQIGPTINQIFLEFYSFYKESITVYICDSSDGKHFIRKRKFDHWFDEFNDNSFIKINDIVLDNDNNEFPISFILKKENKDLHKILDVISNTVSKNNQDKKE